MPSARGTETREAIPPPVLGGREAARLKWTPEGLTGTVEGQTREDNRRLQALNGAALVAREMGMETAFEDSVCFAAHYSYVGTLSDLEGKFLIEGATDITFRMETQKIANSFCSSERLNDLITVSSTWELTPVGTRYS